MRPPLIALVPAAALAATLLVPADARASALLTRDPVAYVYGTDHALRVLNGGATDDDLNARTTKLAASAWSFFRGTSPLFYRDLGELPASVYATGGSDVWITGDAHLQNTGADRGCDDVEQFQVTDTDDAWRGSWTWELHREAVSIVLAGRQFGRTQSQIDADVNTLVFEYDQWINNFHGTNDEVTYRLTNSNTSDLSNSLIQDSKNDTRVALLDRWTTKANGSLTFKADPNLQTVSSTTRTNIVNAIAGYRTTATNPFSTSEAAVKDVRRRLNAGTGSLGRYRWYALLEGKTTDPDDDRIMELKQEVDPAPKQLAPNATGLTGGERPAKALRWLVYRSDQRAGCPAASRRATSRTLSSQVDDEVRSVMERSSSNGDFSFTSTGTEPTDDHPVRCRGCATSNTRRADDCGHPGRPVGMERSNVWRSRAHSRRRGVWRRTSLLVPWRGATCDAC